MMMKGEILPDPGINALISQSCLHLAVAPAQGDWTRSVKPLPLSLPFHVLGLERSSARVQLTTVSCGSRIDKNGVITALLETEGQSATATSVIKIS